MTERRDWWRIIGKATVTLLAAVLVYAAMRGAEYADAAAAAEMYRVLFFAAGLTIIARAIWWPR